MISTLIERNRKRIMQSLGLIASCLLILTSCSKKKDTEPFSIVGTISECSTGAPVPNVRVWIESVDPGNNTFQNYHSYTAGEAITDMAGRFSITPDRHSDANQFNVRLDAIDHYYGDGTFILRDSIKSNIVDGSFKAVRKGWLVFTFSNVINPDTGNYLKVTDLSWNNPCISGQSGVTSSRTPMDPEVRAWKGKIVNGRAWADVPGNDSIYLRLGKWGGPQPATTIKRTVYSLAGDTTYLHINY